MGEMMNGHAFTILRLAVVVCVAVVAASLAATVWYTAHLSADRRVEQVAGCLRANEQRRVINLLVVAAGLDVAAIPIPDCEQIIR